MVEISEIKDSESLKAWLKSQPREVAGTLAARNALRTLPSYYRFSLGRDAREYDMTALPILRCCVSAAVGGKILTPDTKRAAYDAADTKAGQDAYNNRDAYAAGTSAASVAAAAFNAAVCAALSVAENPSGYAAQVITYVGSILGSSVWDVVRADCLVIVAGVDVWATPLWPEGAPEEINWPALKQQILSESNWQPGYWQFWVDWYDAMLDPTGHQPNWELYKQVALINPKVWKQGPEAVSDVIADIERKPHNQPASEKDGNSSHSEVQFDEERITSTRLAMETHKRDLPPTFDAITALIAFEVERLQSRNYVSDLDQQECERQIVVLLTLHDAIEKLRKTVPEGDAVTDQKAEEALGILNLYGSELSKLPREKVADVKNGVWDTSVALTQFGVIAGLSSLGAYFGLPPMGALTVAAMCVAPKKAGEIIAHAKNVIPKS